MSSKRFKEAGNTAVFTTRFVLEDRRDITYVTHEKEDGAWQFFSDDNFENFEEVARVVGLGEIVKFDETILELADLPEGFCAFRQFKGDEWIVQELSSQQ